MKPPNEPDLSNFGLNPESYHTLMNTKPLGSLNFLLCLVLWSLSYSEFEIQVAALFKKHGFTARVVGGSGDAGVDIWVSKDGMTGVVQCKQYRNPAGPSAVRDLYGTIMREGAACGYLVCPSGFTSGVRTFVRKLERPIFLVSLTDLCKIAEEQSPPEPSAARPEVRVC